MILKMLTAKEITNDETYVKVLQQRRNLLFLAEIGGVLALVCSYLIAQEYITIAEKAEREFLSGLYAGIGTGLILVGIIFFVKYNQLLKDKAKLHQKRLAETDERNEMIVTKAVNTATMILLVGIYVAILIAGFFSMQVFWTLWAVSIVYFLIMLISKKYYEMQI